MNLDLSEKVFEGTATELAIPLARDVAQAEVVSVEPEQVRAVIMIPAVRDLPSLPEPAALPARTPEVLAAEIRQEHASMLEGLSRGFQHARKVGLLLLEAKEKVDFGGWTTWVKQNCGFSKRSAETYMRLAVRWVEIEAKTQSVADLTINQALELLKKPKSTSAKKSVVQANGDPADPKSDPTVNPITQPDAPADDAGHQEPEGDDSEHVFEEENDEAYWVVKPRPNKELDFLITDLEKYLVQIVANPDSCDHWEDASLLATAEKLTDLKAVIDQAVTALRRVATVGDPSQR